jgi:glucose-6-phosphate isomerase
MKLLTIEQTDLFSASQRDWIPEEQRDFADARKRFASYTSQSGASIYSGYRDDVLAVGDYGDLYGFAEAWRERFKTLIVVGIGGSSLGAQSVIEALAWSVDPALRRKVVFLDNVDPIRFHEECSALKWEETGVLVVSKSGSTIESLVNATLLLERYNAVKIPVAQHFAVVTTHGEGNLWDWAKRENLKVFDLPKSVGGRYSVFTPVGLFPIAFAGLSATDFLKGAREVFAGEPSDELWRLSARLLDYSENGHNNLVQFIYSSPLYQYGRWFQQLWAESLGKIQASNVAMGSCPVPCLGANDQHSLLQLFMEGPSYSAYAFLQIAHWPVLLDPEFKAPALFDKAAFASGRRVSEILNSEARATYESLKQVGRPVFRFELHSLNAESLGYLYALSMDWTVATASLKKINPFDQEGVESGKKILRQLLKN